MGNTPYTSKKSKKTVKKNVSLDLHNPYKQGWLWKQSRHLKKWRRRWIVTHSHYIYTFSMKGIYENPTEIIDLRNFTYLSRETTYEEPTNKAQQTFNSIKKKFSLGRDTNNYNKMLQIEEENKEIEPSHLILLSDLNADDTFIFKCNSLSLQSHWIYSLERALEYKCNLIQNIIGSEIIKYIVSLYFLSYERLLLSTISTYFNQLFNYKNYNFQYHYYHDAIYWSKHFRSFTKVQFQHKKRNISKELYQSNLENKNRCQKLSLEEQQFGETSFHLSCNDWAKFTKDEKLQLKYFMIFYHEFSALGYKKNQTELSTHYISMVNNRQESRKRHRQYRNRNNIKQNKKKKKRKHKKKDGNVRDISRKYSDETESEYYSEYSDASGEIELKDEIIEELNKLDLKYENIRIDGYEWNKFFNQWITFPFIESLFVSCNISTICIGSANFYDESASMMTQLANNAIDLNISNLNSGKYNKYNKFWDRGGIRWFCDIIKYSYSFSSFLSTIRILSLRDSNLTDFHLKLLCNAINSKVYESSKSLTLNKLILSHNYKLTDNGMKLLFTTIGNKLQVLEELELNDLNITDKIGQIMYDFYWNFHYTYNHVQLYSISLLGNLFTINGFKIMNKLFENHIIDENKFINGDRKIFHIGVNGKRSNVKKFRFDPRLHIVISNIDINHKRLHQQ